MALDDRNFLSASTPMRGHSEMAVVGRRGKGSARRGPPTSDSNSSTRGLQVGGWVSWGTHAVRFRPESMRGADTPKAVMTIFIA